MTTGADSAEEALPGTSELTSEPLAEPAVAAAMRGLDEAEALPVAERVGALENVHRLLADALDPPGGDRPRPGVQGA